ncbi:MAG: hypothetical protein IPH31_20950 [Lewinellaceae bacterium]|nr:hypothetical protein [Lewinellaceae bacterium]
MRIFTFLFLLTLITPEVLWAQNYPANPEPGACYIRCPIEEITEVEKVIVTPSYKSYKVVPAVYKTVEEQVLVSRPPKNSSMSRLFMEKRWILF